MTQSPASLFARRGVEEEQEEEEEEEAGEDWPLEVELLRPTSSTAGLRRKIRIEQEMDRRVRQQREAAHRSLTGGAAAILDRVEELFQKQLEQSREEAAQQEQARQLSHQRILGEVQQMLSSSTPSLQQQQHQQQPQREGVVVLARRSSVEYFVMVHLKARTYDQLLEGCAHKMRIQRGQVSRVFWGDVLIQDDEDVALLEEKAKLIVHMRPEEKEQQQLHEGN